MTGTRDRDVAHFWILFTVLAILGMGCAGQSFGPYVAEDVKFGYKGEIAPEHWADLSPEFAMCRDGLRQSPIEIGELATGKLGDLTFDYHPIPLHMRRDDHTLRIDMEPGSSISLDGTRYDLKEMHFHRISGHAIRGIQFPLEAHIVHESKQGKLAIIAAMLKYSGPNWELNKILRAVPENPGEVADPPDVFLDLSAFLGTESEPKFYRYEGSLTVPPCTEGVQWLVLKNVLGAHRVQQYKFREIVPGNYRPLQPLNDRAVHLQETTPAD